MRAPPGRRDRPAVGKMRRDDGRGRRRASACRRCLREEVPVNATTSPVQVRLARRSPAYWRVTFDNPPINVMGPEMVRQFQQIIHELESDEQVRVVVFDSAVEGYFLNHSDVFAKIEDLTSLPSGPTGLPPW